MPRRALLVGNSVTYSDLGKSVTRPVLERTIQRLASLLRELEAPYAFEVSTCLDERANVVLRKLEKHAQQAAADGELLLFYYFGHGDLSLESKLLLLQPGPKRGPHETLGLEQLETRVTENMVKKSLFIIDCCYAGGVQRTFPLTLKGTHCRIASTMPSSKAYVVTRTLEDPIGKFTSTLMDGFTTTEACVSSTDDHITAHSLFEYVQRSMSTDSGDRMQKPVLTGYLPEPLFEYRSSPPLNPGYSEWADEKTAYVKIVSICRAMATATFANVGSLHGHLVRKYPNSFHTLYKEDDGTFTYKPVKPEVVRRYLSFMGRIQLVKGADFELSVRGKAIADHWTTRCNQTLLVAIDGYLASSSLTREDFIKATKRVLQNRRIPSKQEVADLLTLSGRHLPKADVGMVLDLLAYTGVLRITGHRAYFPW